MSLLGLIFFWNADPNWTPFPTYPVALMFKGDDADVNDFKKRVGGSTAKGLPKFDPNRGVRIRFFTMPRAVLTYTRHIQVRSVEVLKPLLACHWYEGE